MATLKVAGVLLSDRSGSMAPSKTKAENGINGFFTERRKDAVSNNRKEEWALHEFDTFFGEVTGFTNLRKQEFPEYVLVPGGSTALLDSIAKSIAILERFKPDKNKKRILVISTDGYENSSQEHTKSSIKSLILKKTEEGWQFIYLGANQDAVTEAGKLGISSDVSMDYSPYAARATYASTSSLVSRVAEGKNASFTYDERKMSAGK